MSDKKSEDKKKPKEGTEESSILHDRKVNPDSPLPQSNEGEQQYKEQEEFVQKSANKNDDDEA